MRALDTKIVKRKTQRHAAVLTFILCLPVVVHCITKQTLRTVEGLGRLRVKKSDSGIYIQACLVYYFKTYCFVSVNYFRILSVK